MADSAAPGSDAAHRELWLRIEGALDDMYSARGQAPDAPAFAPGGAATLRRAPRFDKRSLALSVFPPATGCGQGASPRGAFPLAEARATRAAALGVHAHVATAGPLLHPVPAVGMALSCVSGADAATDAVGTAARSHSPALCAARAGTYVFTGIVLRNGIARDPFAPVDPPPAPLDGFGYEASMIARDAAVSRYGYTDLADGGVATGDPAAGRVCSATGEYTGIHVSHSFSTQGGEVRLRTGPRVTITGTAAATTTKLSYGYPGVAPVPWNGAFYVYAPLQCELALGDATACTRLLAPRSITLSPRGFACSPPWVHESHGLYAGWCSRPTSDAQPMHGVIADLRDLAVRARAQRAASETGDAGGAAADTLSRALAPLVMPIVRSVYVPHIERDAGGKRIFGVFSDGAADIDDDDGLFADLMAYVVDSVGYDATGEVVPGCDGLMQSSHLCACGLLDAPIGSHADASKGYGSFVRATYRNTMKPYADVDAARCFTAGCNQGGGARPALSLFGRQKCAHKITQCENYETEQGVHVDGSKKDQDSVTMNCGQAASA